MKLILSIYTARLKFSTDFKNLIRFYYDLGASTTLLLRSCRFCQDSCHFDQNFRIVAELPASGMGVYKGTR